MCENKWSSNNALCIYVVRFGLGKRRPSNIHCGDLRIGLALGTEHSSDGESAQNLKLSVHFGAVKAENRRAISATNKAGASSPPY